MFSKLYHFETAIPSERLKLASIYLHFQQRFYLPRVGPLVIACAKTKKPICRLFAITITVLLYFQLIVLMG